MPSTYDVQGIKEIFTARKLAAVTPNDTTVIGCRALYVGTTGDVAIVAVGDTAAVTLVGIPAASLLPVACRKVMATGTTASNLVAFF